MKKYILIVFLIIAFLPDKVNSQENFIGFGFRHMTPISSFSKYFKKTSLEDVDINQGYFPYILYIHRINRTDFSIKMGYAFFNPLQKTKLDNMINITTNYKHSAFPLNIGIHKPVLMTDVLYIGLMLDMGVYCFSEKYSDNVGNAYKKTGPFFGYNFGLSFASKKLTNGILSAFCGYQQIGSYKFRTITVELPLKKI